MNTMTKFAGIAGIAMLALAAIPTSAASIDTHVLSAQVASPTVAAEFSELDTDLNFECANPALLAFDAPSGVATTHKIAEFDLASICGLVRNVPAGVCHYSYGDDWSSVSCIVAVDGLGVCYGYYSYHDDNNSNNDYTSCNERVGL
jgi:hypothetical protein